MDSGEGADLIADLRDLPIESGSADAVAAIHVVEHFYKWEVKPLLLEWKRILKPGGKMILELPCMEKVFMYIAHALSNEEPLMEFMTLHALYGDAKHEDPAMCHRWGWFKDELGTVLADVGMQDIRFKTPKYHFAVRDMRFECLK